ncbi:hypothetical protein CCHL11_08635 [Colletotrichum chlorophyti]|uniref:Uncharacterized protein n=1 Tax=Colletotrichum chlorophyti TaxID=708187 RepID=A0A1Q8RCI2_9PEZI|nr:hypothetical protein CCHL11_08635 [Colletotrichum chlorophyti]
MQLSTLIAASFLAVASAATTYPPINLGRFGYPHGHHFVAWSPFTPTTTQELDDVCMKRGAIQGTATWTAVRVVNTYVLGPLCRKAFDITDDVTNITYTNLELACEDDNIAWGIEPVVTAIVDRSTNKTIETCLPVPTDSPASLSGCRPLGPEGLSFKFACSV